MTQNVNNSTNQRLLSRRMVIALGVIIGILILLAFFLPNYVQIAWERPVDLANPQMTVPRDRETVADGDYPYENSKEPINHPTPTTELTDPAAESGVERGQALYQHYCIACHGKKGSGGEVATVPLVNVAQEVGDASLSKIIIKGFQPAMPGFGDTFTAEQVNDLVSAIRSWEEQDE